jgi:hypothetical protein
MFMRLLQDRVLPLTVALGLAGALSAGRFGEASSDDSSLYAGSVFNEGFEAGTKTSYAAASVTLGPASGT